MTTKIEWTDETWNPVTGCTKVSEGCRNCYADRMSKRLKAMGQRRYANGFDVTLHAYALEEPLGWRKPRKVFVCSMSDLFHRDVPDDYIDRVFAVTALCPQHVFQVLTKRPERMADYLSCNGWKIGKGGPLRDRIEMEAKRIWPGWRDTLDYVHGPWPLPNLWVGTSCEDQATADERIPHLVHCQAAMRFLSLEPLLGPIDVGFEHCGPDKNIHWVIVGGESGPHARPMNLDWVRSIRDQCRVAGVPVFVKQICDKNGRKLPMVEWPDDLRIRQFPTAMELVSR